MSLEGLNIEYELDHIGIAVESLEKGSLVYNSLGLKPYAEEEVPKDLVKVLMYKLGNGAKIELLEAISQDSPIYKFIEKRGAGIHHICLAVKDIRLSLEKLKADGFQLIDKEPRVGVGQCLVAFVHPKAVGGVLLELSQKS